MRLEAARVERCRAEEPGLQSRERRSWRRAGKTRPASSRAESRRLAREDVRGRQRVRDDSGGRARAGRISRRETGQRALGVRGAVARALLLSGRRQVRALHRGQSSRGSKSASAPTSVPHGGERRGGSTNEDKGARGMPKGAGCAFPCPRRSRRGRRPLAAAGAARAQRETAACSAAHRSCRSMG
jgi:hypothetical protein